VMAVFQRLENKVASEKISQLQSALHTAVETARAP
jgi:hypothetical protein